MQDAMTPLNAASQEQLPLSNYLRHLNAFENKDEPSVEDTIAVMLARDAVKQWMGPQVAAEAVSKVVHLDERLRSQSAKMAHLSTCRETTNPSADKWWWWLSTITIDTAEMVEDNAEAKAEADAAGVPRWARWDWLWNLGTVSCLVLSAGLMSQTAKAFSEEGFDLFGTISTIGQGAGLAIVASGAITDDGKKKVQAVLKGFNIPEQYHSEVTFAGSTVMLAASAGLFFNLPTIGNVYYSFGQRQETQGIWDKALESYQRAARFSPQNSEVVLAEGRLHEKLGNFNAAIATYEPEANLGKPEFNNALARVLLTQGFQPKNWEPPLRKRTLSEISLRLDRTDRALPTGALRKSDLTVFLLKVDLFVNQIIYELSKMNWGDLNQLGEIETFELQEKLAFLGIAENQAQRLLSEGIALDTAKLDRTNCYHHTLVGILQPFIFKQPLFYDAVAMAHVYGHPDTHYVNREYACASITGFEGKSANLNDGKFLDIFAQKVSEMEAEAYRAREDNTAPLNDFVLSDLRQSILSRGFFGTASMISDPQTWQTVKQTVKRQVQASLGEPWEQESQAQNTAIFRVLATDKGNIISAFGYDLNSQENLEPFIDQWKEQTQTWLTKLFPESPTRPRIEVMRARKDAIEAGHTFADLKVVIDLNQNEVEIFDWHASYPASFSGFEQPLPGDETAYQSPKTLDNSIEKRILAQILINTINQETDWDKDLTLFPAPADYAVTMASDGQVIAVESMNKIAEEKLSETPLKLIQGNAPKNISNNLPMAKVKLSFKSPFVYRAVPLDETFAQVPQ